MNNFSEKLEGKKYIFFLLFFFIQFFIAFEIKAGPGDNYLVDKEQMFYILFENAFSLQAEDYQREVSELLRDHYLDTYEARQVKRKLREVIFLYRIRHEMLKKACQY